MQNILALETAGDACSVATLIDNAVNYCVEKTPRQHSQRLFVMLRELLPGGDLRAQGISAVAYSSGPGSFTGLRVGASVAQGLAYAHNLPAVAVSTLALQAQTAVVQGKIDGTRPVISIMDARLNEVYGAVIDLSDGLAREVGEPFVCPVETLAVRCAHMPDGTALVGAKLESIVGLKAVADSQGWFISEDVYPEAQAMLSIAQDSLARGEQLCATEIVPRYVRNEVSWKKLSEQGKQPR